MAKIFIVCISLLLSFRADALLKEMAPAAPAIFSPNGLQIFEAPGTGRHLVYDYLRGDPNKPVMVFLHGLGDNLFKLQALENLATKDGFGILRVDLHLHGETLKEYLRIHKELPQQLDYAENTEDLEALIASLKLDDLILIGHSYGGGIAFDLARTLSKKHPEILVESLHQLAPYVQRVDKFLKDYLTSPRFMIAQTSDMMKIAGIRGDFVDNIMQPMADIMVAMFSGVRLMRTHVEDMVHWDAMNDVVFDPILEGYLRSAYERYFAFNLGKRKAQLSDDEKREVAVQVEAAIKVTKGIRGFDLLHGDLPKAMPPIQVMGGANDPLVVPDQLREFAQRLRVARLNVDLIFMKGILADHLFPRRMPQEVYNQIIDFNQKRGRKNHQLINPCGQYL